MCEFTDVVLAWVELLANMLVSIELHTSREFITAHLFPRFMFVILKWSEYAVSTVRDLLTTRIVYYNETCDTLYCNSRDT